MGTPRDRLIVFALLSLMLIVGGMMSVRGGDAAQDSAALSPLDAILEQEPGSEPGAALAHAGANALRAGDAKAAVRLFQRALESSPENSQWKRLHREAELEMELRQRRARPSRPVSSGSGVRPTAPAQTP